MKRKCLLTVIFIFMELLLYANSNTLINISVTTENIDESEATWLSPVVAEKLESNLSKFTDFSFINSANRNDIFEMQKQSESTAFDVNTAIELGKLKNADYVLFTTIRKINDEYTISVRLTNITTGVNRISAIISSPRKAIQNLYSSSGSAIDEITVNFCKAIDQPLSTKEAEFIMKGEIGLQIEEKQAIYDEDISLYNKRIKELNDEIHTISLSTDLDSSAKEEKLKAEKILAEEKLKLAQENKKRIENELQQRKTDELKNLERTAEQVDKLNSITEELNNIVQKLRDVEFENQSLLGQIQVIEFKKQAILDIHESIMAERMEIFNSTLKNVLEEKKKIDKIPYRSAELLADGKTPSEFAIKQRENIFNIEKDKIVNKSQGDIDKITNKLVSQQKTLIKELNDDYSRLDSKKISTLGNELVVTYGAYDGDKQGWNLYITVKSDEIILFQTKAFLSFEALTGKNPYEYAAKNYFEYLDEVDFYDSLFLRGEPILTYELEYTAQPEDVTKPSQYKFNFYNFKYYDTQTLSVDKNDLNSSKFCELELDNNLIIREMSPVCDLQPAITNLSTLKDLIDKKIKEINLSKDIELTVVEFVKKLPPGTNGSTGPTGRYVEFGNWPQTIKEENVSIDSSEIIKINGFNCYKGNDHCFYVRQKAELNRFAKGYKFSNGELIENGKEYYFKIEPIKWRVLTDYYLNRDILLAENILDAKPFDDKFNNYEYSELRHWLNNDFLNNAFTEPSQLFICPDLVYNYASSTGEKNNIYACENTIDKIFLLSVDEIQNGYYGFDSSPFAMDSARIRTNTDYSLAMGASKYDNTNNGFWWLRSPSTTDKNLVRDINGVGFTDTFGCYVYLKEGVVPALEIIIKY